MLTCCDVRILTLKRTTNWRHVLPDGETSVRISEVAKGMALALCRGHNLNVDGLGCGINRPPKRTPGNIGHNSSERAATNTLAPSIASPVGIALPMPRLAPVTIATLPFRLIDIPYSVRSLPVRFRF